MSQLSNQQIKQESKYDYPYHYIPRWDGDVFSQTETLSWGYEYLSYLHFLLDKVHAIGFGSLLDVGCGDGRFLFELSRRLPDRKLAGLDYSSRAVDYARIMTADVNWFCGDIRDENMFDAKFDIITLIETLEHIHPDEVGAFLKGVHHNLAEDGTLIVTVPSKNIPVSRKHYQHFDLNTLTRALSPFFTVVDVSYLNRRSSFLLKLMKKVLSNRFFILNNRKTLKWIYVYYLEHFLFSDQSECRRIAVTCKKLS